MDLVGASRLLLRIGAILGIVLGVLSLVFWAYLIFQRLLVTVVSVNIYEMLLLLASLLAIITSYYIYTRFPSRIESDPVNTGLILVGAGILVAIGAFGVAGLLLVIGGILILIEETS